MATACVERLKLDPNNVPAREKLARIFSERLNQPERGIEQITELLNMPDQPEPKRAEWLSLSAAWHINTGRIWTPGKRCWNASSASSPKVHKPSQRAAASSH